MRRSQRTTLNGSLIAALALALTWATVGSAEPWFAWRKPEKAGSGKATSGAAAPARPSYATQPATKSDATTPTVGNRRQAAPVSASAEEKAAPRHWWNRIGGNSNKDDAPQKEKTPVVVRKSLPPPPSRKIASRQARQPEPPATPEAAAWLDDRAFIALSDPEPDDVVARVESPSYPRIARPAARAGSQPRLPEPEPRRRTPGVRYVAYDDAGETGTAPSLPPLRQAPATGRALLPFEKAEHSGKIQIRPSPKSDELISITVRDAGRYVVVGQYTDAGDATLSPHRHLNRKHVTLLGCWGYEYTHLHRALQMLARSKTRFPFRSLISREYRLDQAGEALSDMERLAVVKALIRP